MAEWIERYQAGECAEVWNEMQALGTAIGKPAHRKAVQKVVRATMDRAHRNVVRLFEELPTLGYRFISETPVGDHPLELRIEHALEYVKKSGGKKYSANPWAHPALAWIDDEEIEVPVQFLKGKAARSNYRPPGPRTSSALDALERKAGRPLSVAARAWFETVGSVDLTGTHPVLNPEGKVTAMLVTLRQYPDPGSDAGAEFVAAIRHAFHWAGFPGWSMRPNPPERELNWLRSKLLPL